MLENNNDNVCGDALVSHDDDDDDDDDISKLKMITTTTKRVLVWMAISAMKKKKRKNVQKIKKKKKKKKPFETERMSMKDDDGHCGFGVRVRREAAENGAETTPLTELNHRQPKRARPTNRRDHFTPFASNLHNKILLKRICIKAGNNARFFLSKTSKAFRKVTLREFGVMTSSNIEQGRASKR